VAAHARRLAGGEEVRRQVVDELFSVVSRSEGIVRRHTRISEPGWLRPSSMASAVRATDLPEP
jgi:hypothetical protein